VRSSASPYRASAVTVVRQSFPIRVNPARTVRLNLTSVVLGDGRAVPLRSREGTTYHERQPR
jgi:hypothetical protein